MASALSYMKNLGRSVKYSAIDSVKKMNPVVVSLYKDNQEAVADIYKSIKKITSPSASGDSKQLVGTAGGLAKAYFTNLYHDALTGNFYNRERIKQAEDEMVNKMMGGDMDFGLDDDMDFDFGGGSSSDDDDMSFSFDDADEIASKTTTAIGMISARSAQYQVEANREATKVMYDQNAAIFGNLHADLNAINTNVGMVMDYLKDNSNTHYENSKKFYETATEGLNRTNELLAQLVELNKVQAGMIAATSRNSNRIQFSDLFTSDGALDISAYVKLVQENIEAEDSGMGDMIKMMIDSGMLDTMVASPLQGVTDAIVRATIPAIVGEGMKEFNKSLSGFFGAAITKLGRMAEDEDGTILGTIGKYLGYQDFFKTKLDVSNYEKGVVPFDGVTRKAIIEVIPTYLSKIYSAISGSKESRYDYNRAKFVSMDDLQGEIDSLVNRHARTASMDVSFAMRKMLNSIDFGGGAEQRKQIEEDMQKIFEYQLRQGEAFNKKMTADRYGLKGAYSDENLALITQMWNQLPKSIRLQYAANLTSSRSDYNRSMRELERQSLTPLAALYNGSTDNTVFNPKKSIAESMGEVAQRGSGNNGPNTPSSPPSGPQSVVKATTKSTFDQEKLAKALQEAKEDWYGKDDMGITEDIINSLIKDTKPFSSVRKALDVPAKGFSALVDRVDQHLYNFVFGDDDWEKSVDEDGFMGAILHRIQDTFDDFDNWMRENIFTPITSKINKKSIHDASATFLSWFGIDLDQTTGKVKDYLFNEDNGILSGFKDSLKESFSGLWDYTKASFGDVMNFFGIKGELNELGAVKNSHNQEISDKIRSFTRFSRRAQRKGDSESRLDNLLNTGMANGIFEKKPEGTGEVEDIDSAAAGLQRVTKTGVIAVSEGEMIVPPDRNPYNIARRLKAENRAKQKFADSIGNYAAGGTFNPDGDEYSDEEAKAIKELADILLTKVTPEGIKRAKELLQFYRATNNKKMVKAANIIIGKAETMLKDKLAEQKQQYTESDYENLPYYMQVGKELENVGRFVGGKVSSAATSAYGKISDQAKEKADESIKAAGKDVMKNIKQYLPDATVGAGIGAGGAILTGAIINPIFAAAAGAAIGIAKNSSAVQDMLFGKRDPNDDNKRTGGLFNKNISNAIEKYLPDMAKGSTLGFLAGLPLGGPVAGVILGSAIGFAKNNSAVQSFLFGDEEKKGLIPKVAIEKVKHALPKMGAGAVLGLVGGPFGIATNILLGSAVGFASDTDTFKDAIFGKMDEGGVRRGGLLGSFRENVIEPNQIFLKQTYMDVQSWFKDTIITNTMDLYRPLKQSVKNGVNSVFDFIKARSKNLYDVFLKTTLGKKIDELFKGTTKLFQKTVGGIVRGGMRVVGGTFNRLGNFGRAMTDKQIMQGKATDLTAAERMVWRNRDRFVQRNAGKSDPFRVMDQTLAQMSDEQIQSVYDDLQYARNATEAIRNNKRKVIKDIRGLQEIGFLNSKQEKQLLSLLEIGDWHLIERFVEKLPVQITGKDGNTRNIDKQGLLKTLRESMDRYTKAHNAEKNAAQIQTDSMNRLREQFGLDDKDFSDRRIQKIIESEQAFRNGEKTPESIFATEQELEDQRWKTAEEYEKERHKEILNEFSATRETLKELLSAAYDEDTVIESSVEDKLTGKQRRKVRRMYAAEHIGNAAYKASKAFDTYSKIQLLASQASNPYMEIDPELAREVSELLNGKAEPLMDPEEYQNVLQHNAQAELEMYNDNENKLYASIAAHNMTRNNDLEDFKLNTGFMREAEYFGAPVNPEELIAASNSVLANIRPDASQKFESTFQGGENVNYQVQPDGSYTVARGDSESVENTENNLSVADFVAHSVVAAQNEDKQLPSAPKVQTEFYQGHAIKYVRQGRDKDANGEEDWMPDPSDSETREFLKERDADKETQKGIFSGISSLPDKIGGLFGMDSDAPEKEKKGFLARLFDGGFSSIASTIGLALAAFTAFPQIKKVFGYIWDKLGVGDIVTGLPSMLGATVVEAAPLIGETLGAGVKAALFGTTDSETGERQGGLVRSGMSWLGKGAKNILGKVGSALNPLSGLGKSGEEVAAEREDLVIAATNAAKHSFLTGNGTRLAQSGEGMLSLGSKALNFLANNKAAKFLEKVPVLGKGSKLLHGAENILGKAAGAGSSLLTTAGDFGAFFMPETFTGAGTRDAIKKKIIDEVNDIDGKNSLITDIATKGFKGTFAERFGNSKVGKAVSKVTDPLADFMDDKVFGKAKNLAKKYAEEHADGMVGKFIQKMSKEITEFLTDSKIVKFVKKGLSGELAELSDKAIKEALEKFADVLVKRLSKYISEEAAESVGNAVLRAGGWVFTAGIANLVLGVKAFMDGWFNADEVFEISEPDFSMKLISATVATLNDVFLQGIIPVDLLMDMTIWAMNQVPVFDSLTAGLNQKRQALKDEVEDYNNSMGLEGKDRLSVDEYLGKDKLGARIKRKIGAMWQGTKDAFKTSKALSDQQMEAAMASGDYGNAEFMSFDPALMMSDPYLAMQQANMNAYYMAQSKKAGSNTAEAITNPVNETMAGAEQAANTLMDENIKSAEEVATDLEKSIKDASNGGFDSLMLKLGEQEGGTALSRIMDYTAKSLLYPATAMNSMINDLEPTIMEATKKAQNGAVEGTSTLFDILGQTLNSNNNSSSSSFGGTAKAKTSSNTYTTTKVQSMTDDETTTEESTEDKSLWRKLLGVFSGSGSGLRRRFLSGRASGMNQHSNPPTDEPYAVDPISTLTGSENERRLTNDEYFVSQTNNPLSNTRFNTNDDTTRQTVAEAACAPAVATMAVNSAWRNGDGGHHLTFRQAIRNALPFKAPDSGVTADYFVDQFRNVGLSTSFISSSDPARLTDDVLGMLRQNRPVILMGNDKTNNSKVRSPFGPTSHYVLATGVSPDGKYIYVNDPENNKPNVAYPISILKSVDLGVAPIAKNARMDSLIKNSKVMQVMASYRANGLPGNSNREKVFNYLRSQGVSAEVAAGIIGNIMQESGCDPEITQGGHKYYDANPWSGGPGSGLCQWEKPYKGSAGDRFNGLVALARARGKEWYDFESQLMFLMKELQTESTFVSFLKSKYSISSPSSYLTMNTNNAPSQYRGNTQAVIKFATEVFCTCFERCNKSQANMSYRESEALKAYNEFSGNPVTTQMKAIQAPRFHAYSDVTDKQLEGIATIALKEQGDSPAGQMAEASLLLNLAERDYGEPYNMDKVAKMAKSGWFAYGFDRFSNPTVSKTKNPELFKRIENVVKYGKRTIPGYIDEHDYVGDISSATNDGVAIDKNDPSQYKQHKTIIQQASSVGSGKWTYYTHPSHDASTDPFGYTDIGAKRRSQTGDGYYSINGDLVGSDGNLVDMNTGQSTGVPAWSDPKSILDVFTIFDDLANAYGLTSNTSMRGGNDTGSTSGAVNTTGATVSDPERARLQRLMADSFIKSENALPQYSQTARYKYNIADDGTITGTSADCSSLTQGVYKKFLGVDPGSWTGEMLESPNTYVVEKGTGMPGSAPTISKLQLGDLLIYGPSPSGKHVEMYTGGDMTMGHGSAPGPHYARPTGDTSTKMINYQSQVKGLNEVRRWVGFRQASDFLGMGSGLMKKTGAKVSKAVKSIPRINRLSTVRDMIAGKGSDIFSKFNDTNTSVSYTTSDTKESMPIQATNDIRDAVDNAYNYSLTSGSDVYVNATANTIEKAPDNNRTIIVQQPDNSAQYLKLFKTMIGLMSKMAENTDNIKQIVGLVTQLVSVVSSMNTSDAKSVESAKKNVASIQADLMSAMNSAHNQGSGSNVELMKLINDCRAIAGI